MNAAVVVTITAETTDNGKGPLKEGADTAGVARTQAAAVTVAVTVAATAAVTTGTTDVPFN